MSSQKEKNYRLFFPSMEKRNSKSISEEISKILPSVEKEEVKLKTKEISNFLSVMRFRKNPVHFGRNIEDSLVMLFSEKQAKYSRNIEEIFFGRHLPATACCSWFTSRGRSFPAIRCRGSSCRHDEQRRVRRRLPSGSPGAGVPPVRRLCRGRPH